MIDPKELRPGNLGKYKRSVYVYDICPNKTTGLNGSDPQIFFHRVKDDVMYKCTFASIDPIPITPEWRDRCPDAWQVFDKYLRTGILPHLKYMHQAQNLFYDLTGSELTIKQPEAKPDNLASGGIATGVGLIDQHDRHDETIMPLSAVKRFIKQPEAK